MQDFSLSIRVVAQQEVKPYAALFVSDVHLCEDMPRTAQDFFDFLNFAAQACSHLFLLGDIFEYWAGDDDDTPLISRFQQCLAHLHQQQTKVYWLAGNRDFLLSDTFCQKTQMQLLPDICELQCELQLHTYRFLLLHGDELCTDDVAYQKFRQVVRSSQWKTSFLSQSLIERKKVIDHLRAQSQNEKSQKTMAIMDVNALTVENTFQQYHINTMIHGHTHRPYQHTYANGTRWVLPDWDSESAEANPSHVRGGWLSLNQQGDLQAHTIQEIWQTRRTTI